jgi:hypothetical protein
MKSMVALFSTGWRLNHIYIDPMSIQREIKGAIVFLKMQSLCVHVVI